MSTAHEIISPRTIGSDRPTPVTLPGTPRPWSADPYSEALVTGRGPLFLRRSDGWLLPLEVERWCAGADAADLRVLDHCEGAVLDVGCGPGRLVAELASRGLPALGVDISEAAVARTVRLGGQALRRSVFEPLPAEGRWDTVLLIDGNIGIGGDPGALLRRMSQLLGHGGLLITETAPDSEVGERVTVQVVRLTAGAHGSAGPPFPWARLGTPALLRLATQAGWHPERQWTTGGRSFVSLRNHGDRSPTVISSRQDSDPSPGRVVAGR
ncbi:class I SAM-dependent methyltransferase [Streptomyces turgidiscabies]|uniref:Methyltransferase domain protein n=1 Tax=Streptomyces turgidiscabies (strain Car8) TaxID=698760 RepID=L7EUI9_STRT8|nr:MULTISPECIES: class I SAM-dependent methyltransferase [Streptomyces]ELP62050.1 methyltransferase domain protein [Streptomyces turgidiscabies Car8]MDX3499662.1 class I SAM-dependent methyltransferase [Streptomyces turgidiscabies]GAQ73394.1 Mg-protoporphyrin IX methyl transferase [Streptomyces turgidiscabies]